MEQAVTYVLVAVEIALPVALVWAVLRLRG